MVITFITGNERKLESIQKYFPELSCVVQDISELQEIQSFDIRKIAAQKSLDAYNILKHGAVLVEDSSMTFDALGNLPGPFIKWFLRDNSVGTQGLCKMLNAFNDRSATIKACFALYEGLSSKPPITFYGIQRGSIATNPSNDVQYGFDSIFIPDGFDKTCAELTLNELREVSARRKAIEKLKKYLETIEIT